MSVEHVDKGRSVDGQKKGYALLVDVGLGVALRGRDKRYEKRLGKACSAGRAGRRVRQRAFRGRVQPDDKVEARTISTSPPSSITAYTASTPRSVDGSNEAPRAVLVVSLQSNTRFLILARQEL